MNNINSLKPLIISMGFNGYQWAYKRNIITHELYAKKYGYDYAFVRKPYFTTLLMECAWLKIPLILSALKARRPWVLYIDADIEIKDYAPAIETVLKNEKNIYLANGFSGRLNAGVILVEQNERAIEKFQEILNSANLPLPPEDDIGWGENGHVIHFLKNYDGLEVLDSRWNNNSNPDLDDYFRHYSSGPMRKYFNFSWVGKIMLLYGNIYVAVTKKISHSRKLKKVFERIKPRDFFTQLSSLYSKVRKNHSEFKDVSISFGSQKP